MVPKRRHLLVVQQTENYQMSEWFLVDCSLND